MYLYAHPYIYIYIYIYIYACVCMCVCERVCESGKCWLVNMRMYKYVLLCDKSPKIFMNVLSKWHVLTHD